MDFSKRLNRDININFNNRSNSNERINPCNPLCQIPFPFQNDPHQTIVEQQESTLEDKYYDLVLSEYKELFSQIYLIPNSEFLSILEKYILISLSKYKLEINDYLLNKFLTLINHTYSRDYAKVKSIFEKKQNENKLFLSKNFIPHCNNFHYPLHVCGKKFYENSNYLICPACKMVYEKSLVLFHCSPCNVDFFSQIKEDKNIYRLATWQNYHCSILINDYMKCIQCKNEPLYININNRKLCCLKCEYEIDQMEINWKCIACLHDFKSQAKIYNPLEYKTAKIAIKNTLLNKQPAYPKVVPCCNIPKRDICKYEFHHKKTCDGLIYLGMMNNKVILVCSKCQGLYNYDTFMWFCPICFHRFKLTEENNNVNNINNNLELTLKEHNYVDRNSKQKSKNGHVKSCFEWSSNNNKKTDEQKNNDETLQTCPNDYIAYKFQGVFIGRNKKNLACGSNSKKIISSNTNIEINNSNSNNSINNSGSINNNNSNNNSNNNLIVFENSPKKKTKTPLLNSGASHYINLNNIKSLNLNNSANINNSNSNSNINENKSNLNEIQEENNCNEIENVENIEGVDNNNRSSETQRKLVINIPVKKRNLEIIKRNLLHSYEKDMKSKFNSSINNPVVNIKQSFVKNKIPQDNEKDSPSESPSPPRPIIKSRIYSKAKILNSMKNLYKKKIQLPSFKIDECNIIKKIGQGTFASIYFVEKDNKNYALRKVTLKSLSEVDTLMSECEMIKYLSETCKNINLITLHAVQVVTYDQITHIIYILMDLAERDWEKEIEKRQKTFKYYKENELIKILKELVHTFCEMEKHNISHRDIKPQNILVFNVYSNESDGKTDKENMTPEQVYKISDFGEAKKIIESDDVLNKNPETQTIRGTELYMSPLLFQALKDKNNNGLRVRHNPFKSDVFSLGLCFIHACTLNLKVLHNVREIRDTERMKKIVGRFLSMRYSTKFIDVICRMLVIEEQCRFDFLELEDYFDEINL